MAEERNLVRVELSFVTSDAPDALGDRIKESVALIVGRQALEEFRVRTMPLDPKKKDHLRVVD
jgi:hypothetical protein